MATNNPYMQGSAQLKGTTVRQGGQLFEEGATTPFGAKTAGANEDQAKMAGVPTPPVIEERKPAPAPQPQRQQPRKLGDDEKVALSQVQEKVRQMSNLGGYVERAGAVAIRRMNEIGAAPADAAATVKILDDTVDPDMQIVVGGQPMTVSEAVAQFAADPQNEAPAIAVLNTLNAGRPPEQQFQIRDIKNWVDTSPRALGEQAQAAFAMDRVTLADLNDQDLQEMGFADAADMNQQIADIFGLQPEQVGTLTLGEIRDEVEQARDEMFAELDNLRAELNNVPPGSAAAQQIRQRIQDLTGEGLAAAEREVDALVQELDMDRPIQIGDQEFSLEDLLSDQQVSDLVVEWLNADTPEERERILPSEQFGALTDWLEENQQTMRAVAQELEAGVAETEATQQQLQTLRTLPDQELLSQIAEQAGIELNLDQAMTDEQMAQTVDQLKNVGAFQVLSPEFAPEWLDEETRADLAAIITPANFTKFGNLSLPQLINGRRYAKAIEASPVLQEFLGTPEILTDVNEVRQFQDAVKTVDTLGTSGLLGEFQTNPKFKDMVLTGQFTPAIIESWGDKETHRGTSVLTDPTVVQYIKDNNLTGTQLNSFLRKSADALEQFEQEQDQRRYDPEASVSENLQNMIPGSPTLAELSGELQNLKARIDAGDKSAQKAYNRLKVWDKNNDGIITSDEADQILEQYVPREYGAYVKGDVQDLPPLPDTSRPDPTNNVWSQAVEMADKSKTGILSYPKLKKLAQAEGGLEAIDPEWLARHSPAGLKTVQDIKTRMIAENLKGGQDPQTTALIGDAWPAFQAVWNRQPIPNIDNLETYNQILEAHERLVNQWENTTDPIKREAYHNIIAPMTQVLINAKERREVNAAQARINAQLAAEKAERERRAKLTPRERQREDLGDEQREQTNVFGV